MHDQKEDEDECSTTDYDKHAIKFVVRSATVMYTVLVHSYNVSVVARHSFAVPNR